MQSYGDPDDDYSRLRKKLQERRQQLVDDVIAGGCTPEEYHALCGRIVMLGEVLEMQREIRRGEDLRAPAQREPLPSPEE